MGFFHNRRVRRHARHVLHYARHIRNMRHDLMSEEDLRRFGALEAAAVRSLGRGQASETIEKATHALHECADRFASTRSCPGLRENLEVLVVAVAVAMGVRTYFFQPFKIPTGSMQPTLYGVYTTAQDRPSLMDRMPLKLVKWAVTGQWYTEIRTRQPGYMSLMEPSPTDPTAVFVYIGGVRYKVPRDATLKVGARQHVEAGHLIWSGIRTAGDHVFVNRVRWNFMRPARGEVIVFSTENIPTLPQGTHYIKRLIGLPEETVQIRPPDVLVNGAAVHEPRGIERIATRQPGYSGFAWAGTLMGPDARYAIGAAEYFAMGDNTGNSRDSRYWGSVPQRNMVGPASMVYWPFSRRWGRIN